jgi:hypothetical protein
MFIENGTLRLILYKHVDMVINELVQTKKLELLLNKNENLNL